MMLRRARQQGARRFSCPPLALDDLYFGYYSRTFRHDPLTVQPEFWARFPNLAKVEIITEGPAVSIYRLDDDLCLKLLPIFIDIDRIARTMRTASQVVAVPRVHHVGRTSNCAYMLMDWVHGPNVFDARLLEKQFPPWAISARLERSIARLVEDLYRVGVAHNDLYATNLFVDRYWRIACVIDWDTIRESSYGEEYVRRVQSYWRPHDWDYIFAKYCRPLGTAHGVSPADGTRISSGVEPYWPYLSVTGGNGNLPDVPSSHVLGREAWMEERKAPDRPAVILCGGDGSLMLEFLGSTTALCGVPVSRVFTVQPPTMSNERKVPVTSLSDLLPLFLTREDELAYLIVRECPAIVLLVNWDLPLAPSFFDGLFCPLDLCDKASLPGIFYVLSCATEDPEASSPANFAVRLTAGELSHTDDEPDNVVLFDYLIPSEDGEPESVHLSRTALAAVDRLFRENILSVPAAQAEA